MRLLPASNRVEGRVTFQGQSLFDLMPKPIAEISWIRRRICASTFSIASAVSVTPYFLSRRYVIYDI
ncbi:hypothetical protein [Nostoc sp.]|uniref:hypothetical protein n=1 Tax=Nostoc sp. TaxID=1180 RepID=UPI0035937DC9